MKTKTLIRTLQQLNKYVQNGSFADFVEHMAQYDNRPDRYMRDFHNIRINVPSVSHPVSDAASMTHTPVNEHDLETVREELEKLFLSLHIPRNQWDRYLKSELNMYTILIELKKNHPARCSAQFDSMLNLIESKKDSGINQLILYSVLGLSLFGNALMIPALTEAKEALLLFLSTPTALPILGLTYTCAVASYSFYQNYYSQKQTTSKRVRDAAFLSANTLLNMAAYGVWIAASAVMSPLVAGLFVAATCVDVIKESVIAYQDRRAFKNSMAQLPQPGATTEDNIAAAKDRARQDSGYRKHKAAAIINSTAAVILAVNMAVWCFFPGGILLTAGALATIGIVGLGRKWALNYNEKSKRASLQTTLRAIEQEAGTDSARMEEGFSAQVVSPALGSMRPATTSTQPIASAHPASVNGALPAPKRSSWGIFNFFHGNGAATSDPQTTALLSGNAASPSELPRA